MKILAMDTSTATLTTAVLDGDDIIAEAECEADRSHSTMLMGAIESVLQQVDFAPEDLQAIAVGSGPGSYTGVRIGVTVAKTLAWSWEIPVISVSSLEGWARSMAAQQKFTQLWASPMINARRGRVYTGLYARHQNGWQQMKADGNYMLQDWIDDCIDLYKEADKPADGFLFGGDLPPELFDQEHEKMERAGIQVERSEIKPRASEIARCAKERWVESSFQSHDLVPNYTRLAEAEAKLRTKH